MDAVRPKVMHNRDLYTRPLHQQNNMHLTKRGTDFISQSTKFGGTTVLARIFSLFIRDQSTKSVHSDCETHTPEIMRKLTKPRGKSVEIRS